MPVTSQFENVCWFVYNKDNSGKEFFDLSLKSNMNHYQVFVYAAKYLNLTKAAQELYMTQSSATRAINQLESQLGCQLFVRNSKGLLLTNEGEFLYQSIEPAIHELEKAEHALYQMNHLQIGTIRIAVNNLAAEWIIEMIKNTFSQKYPGISIVVSTIDDQDLLSLLDKGYVNIAFRYEQQENPLFSSDRLQQFEIEKESYGSYQDIFIVGPAYRQLTDAPVTLPALRHLPLIAPVTQDCNAAFYMPQLRPDGFLDNDCPVDGLRHRLKLAEMNFGVSYFPEHFIQTSLKQEKLYKLSFHDFEMRSSFLYTLHSRRHPQSEATKAFFNFFYKDIF